MIFDNYITSFDSVKECSEMTGLKYGTIRDSLTGRRKRDLYLNIMKI